jgi:hypothetical protein
MAERPNIIENRTHNFNENDVQEETDRNRLRWYLTQVRKDINILEGKIKKERAKESTGYGDKKRIQSLESARDIQQMLEEIVKIRMDTLNENNKEWYQLELNFFEEARKAVDNGELSGELFDVLVKRAQGYYLGEEDE